MPDLLLDVSAVLLVPLVALAVRQSVAWHRAGDAIEDEIAASRAQLRRCRRTVRAHTNGAMR